MSEDIYVESVRSNIDVLSAERINQALFRMVEETLEESAAFLRFTMPVRSGAMAEHAKKEKVSVVAGHIRGALGIPPIHEQDGRPTFGEYKHSSYPLFAEGGTTTPITPAVRSAMWNKPEGIFGRKGVRGQRGQHFMAKTYAEAQAFLRSDRSIGDAIHAMDIEAEAAKAAIETT